MTAKQPTRAQRIRWEKIRELGCIICGAVYCSVHHAKTGGGGRRNHDLVFPLCYEHHQGEQGIHFISRRVWEERYGTEDYFLQKTKELLGE